MKNAAKIAVVALLGCVSAWALVQAQAPPNTLVERYPELFGKNSKPCVVNFTAPWCGYCQRLKPHLETLKKEGYRVRVYDYDDHNALAKWFHTSSIPHTLLWKDQVIQNRWVGVVNLRSFLTAEYKIKAVVEKQNAEKVVPEESDPKSSEREAGRG